MTGREKVVVAMSGGVDSSVAACLLRQQGYEVLGLFMRTGIYAPEPACTGDVTLPIREKQGCCSASDAADARFVAGKLGIPFYALNFENDFDELIDYFADEYAAGRTPNPCVVCNNRLKFGRLFEYADAVGARYVATGHYARIDRANGRLRLRRGCDRAKDQSYVLAGLGRDSLERVIFPVGELTKEAVRDVARRNELPVSDKPDSVEICFVPDQDYARVVRDRRPEAFAPGDVIDRTGAVLGRHKGVPHYTIGQRRGLGIAAGKPIYVTRLDVRTNTIQVGDSDALLHVGLTADCMNWLVDTAQSFQAEVQIRYMHRAAPASVRRLDGDQVRVTFDEPQRAVTPGQAAVVYDDDVVLGGGWITSAMDKASDEGRPPTDA